MLTPVGIRGAVPRVLGRYVPSVLGAVWVAAAWAKIIHPDETLSAFRGSFADLGLNTVAGTRWLLVALIAGELCLGFGLIFEIAPKRMVVMSACALAFLTIWVGFLANKNPESPCGCGLKLGWWESGGTAKAALIRNLVLLGAHAGALACLCRRSQVVRVEQPPVA